MTRLSPLSGGGCRAGGGLLIPATKPENKYLEHISSALVSFQYEQEGLKGIFCALPKAGDRCGSGTAIISLAGGVREAGEGVPARWGGSPKTLSGLLCLSLRLGLYFPCQRMISPSPGSQYREKVGAGS